MSKAAYLEWYKAGSHAVRSACEQGVAAAEKAEQHFTDADAKTVAADGKVMLGQHQEAFAGFLTDIGEKPNYFVDQIMKGIGEGVALSLEAAEEPEITDVALVTGEQTGLHYFIAAYGAHGAAATALGMPAHAETLKQMIEECYALDRRYTAVAEASVNKAAAA
jgi:ferritin-like metal-binding protein YciE